ncbi:MAG: hypothetical protein Q8P81_03090 [Nanoarchaeota archaeon]|nr:hypothetical protein [Nanoarchaeota archaeon]
MMKFLLLIIIKFFLISALFIVSNGDLNLREQEDRVVFAEEYSTWLSNVFNQGTDIGGFVVNSQWLPSSDPSGRVEKIDRIRS